MTTSARESLQPLTRSQVETLTAAATSYHEAIWLADDYLAARGISQASAGTAQLGVVTDPAPGHERFTGWLSIPYLGVSQDGEDQCWSIRFRCLERHSCKDHGHGKYQTVSGEKSRLYNARAILSATDSLHVAEGELDAIVLNQCGLPAVAVPGANNWKYHYTRLMAGFSKVYVWGDPDAAGAEFVSTVCNAVRNSAAVKLTLGDVNETYVQGGYAAVREAMEAVRWG